MNHRQSSAHQISEPAYFTSIECRRDIIEFSGRVFFSGESRWTTTILSANEFQRLSIFLPAAFLETPQKVQTNKVNAS